MNFVDLIILVVVALFLYLGYLRGFIRDFLDLLALVGAIFLASVTYGGVGLWLNKTVAIPESFSGTVGFFAVWFAVMLAYYGIMTFFYDLIPERICKSAYNKWLGLVPGLLRSILYIWFTVNLVYSLAISGPIKQTLDNSYISSYLIKNNGTMGDFLGKTFGPAVIDSVNFLTVRPQSNEKIDLGYTTTKVTVDTTLGKEMLTLINNERKDRGLDELTFDDELAKVGERHCLDMFARGYFSHYTLEGKTPFDRMDSAKIFYLIAGENLALAPTLEEAFQGLMESPGHKANMLSSDFGKVGIGVVDGGPYGLMFAQEFTN